MLYGYAIHVTKIFTTETSFWEKNKMLKDRDILPICRRYARAFIKQAKHLGKPDDVFDELMNVAYVAAKQLNKNEGAATWIMWSLIKHTKIQTFEMIDRRLLSHPRSAQPDEFANRTEERELLLAAISKLDPTERALVYCYYRDGMTFRAIGKDLGFSGCWASKLIKDVVNKLREEMNDDVHQQKGKQVTKARKEAL